VFSELDSFTNGQIS